MTDIIQAKKTAPLGYNTPIQVFCQTNGHLVH